MTTFMGVLIDPAQRTPFAVPMVAQDAPHALMYLHHIHPSLVVHGLFDLATLNLWEQHLDAMNEAASQPEVPMGLDIGFVAVLMDAARDAPFTMTVQAGSIQNAAQYLNTMRPHQPLNALFARSLLARWREQMIAMEQTPRSTLDHNGHGVVF